ncbi:MAG: methyltransferase domain-containing protein [Acidobacteria bacterium]|nr:methyltransferase domain-containing protein [Acidobacteriota bacterium]
MLNWLIKYPFIKKPLKLILGGAGFGITLLLVIFDAIKGFFFPRVFDNESDELSYLFFTHVPWEHIWQRNHHTVYRLSKKHRVIYFQPIPIFEFFRSPIHYLKRRIIFFNENLILYHPLIAVYENKVPFGRWLNERRILGALRNIARRFHFPKPVLWFYFPQLVRLADKFDKRLIVYDIQDEYAGFTWASPDISEREKELLRKADLVFTGTLALYRKKKPFVPHNEVYFFPCGAEFDHFAKAKENLPRPEDLTGIKSPILGYFGSIEERIDFELLEYIADKRRDINIVMVGPYWRVPESTLNKENIHFLGKKEYKDLPAYLRYFDIPIMPFALNELTLHINPTKLLEYFAAEKPVISTAIPDVVELYSDYLYIARDKKEFLSLVEKILDKGGDDRVKRALELAKRNSWEGMVAGMEGHIKRLIREKEGIKGMRETALSLLKEKLKETKDEALLKEAEAKVECWLNAWEREARELSLLLSEEIGERGRREVYNWVRGYLGEQAPEWNLEKPVPLSERQAELFNKLVSSRWERSLPYFRNKLLEYIFVSSYEFLKPDELKLTLREKGNLSLLKDALIEYQRRLSRVALARDREFIFGESHNFLSLFTGNEPGRKEGEEGSSNKEDTSPPQRGDEPSKGSLGRMFDLIYHPRSPYLIKRTLLPLALLRELRNYLARRIGSSPLLSGERLPLPLLSGRLRSLRYLPALSPAKAIELFIRMELILHSYELLILIEKREKVSTEKERNLLKKAGNWSREKLIDFITEVDKDLRLLRHIRTNEERIGEGVASKVLWEHLTRYRFLNRFFTGKETVLDAGCGAGLGVEIISEKVKRVFALDRAYPSFIEKKDEKINFIGGDLFHLPFKEKIFDAIILLEVIEHLSKPEKVMEELLPLLKDDGFLAISTPNREFYSPGLPLPWNPFHHREYNHNELTEFLSLYFREIDVYGEHLAPQVDKGIPDPFSFIIGKYDHSDFPIIGEELESAMSFIIICRGKKRG